MCNLFKSIDTTMTKIRYFVIYTILSTLLFGSCVKDTSVFAPDNLYPSEAPGQLYLTNRSENELLLIQADGGDVKKQITFNTPVNGLITVGDNTLWVVCDGSNGTLYELNKNAFDILSETPMGACPSAILYNTRTNSLWITQRFNNSIWEVNPKNKEIVSVVEVGREPVDLVSFANDNYILIANNMPEMSSLDFPVAAQLSVVDVQSKEVVKRIMLPNGSTDVKAITTSENKDYAYVTHLLARYQLPTNQVDRGWMSTNALSIIDLNTQELLTSVLLDTPQKGSANPWGVTVSPDDKHLIVSASGVHELVHIDRIALHERLDKVRVGEKVNPSTKEWKDIPNDAGFLYGISDYIPTEGKGPRSVIYFDDAVYTANYFTGEIVKIDLNTKDKTIIPSDRNPVVSTVEGKGYMYFYDASIGFQGWQSCASCHPNDARVDGLNWDLLNDGLGNPKNTKSLVLSHVTPPSMITGIRKSAELAVKSGLKHILFAETDTEITDAIDVYLNSLRPVQSPYLVDGELSESAKRGKADYDRYCLSCHSGSNYTDQKQYVVDWATGSVEGIPLDVPTLREIWRTGPYLYDGRSATLREMLDIHGPGVKLSESESNDLAEYVLSL